MPGVEVIPFHTDTPSLPRMTREQWAKFLSPRRAGKTINGPSSSTAPLLQQQQQQPKEQTSVHSQTAGSQNSNVLQVASNSGRAAIVLASPHFVELELFLQRLGTVLPGMPVSTVYISLSWYVTPCLLSIKGLYCRCLNPFVLTHEYLHASGHIVCLAFA